MIPAMEAVLMTDAAAALDQCGQRVLHPEPYAAQIDRDDAIELLLGDFGGEAALALDAGVIVDDVEPAEFLDGARHHRTRIFGIGNVGANRDGLATRAGDAAHRILGAGRVDIDYGDFGAFAREKRRRCAAHP